MWDHISFPPFTDRCLYLYGAYNSYKETKQCAAHPMFNRESCFFLTAMDICRSEFK